MSRLDTAMASARRAIRKPAFRASERPDVLRRARRDRRRRVAVTTSVALAAAAALLCVVLGPQLLATPPPVAAAGSATVSSHGTAPAPPPLAGHVIRLEDGSRAERLGGSTRLELARETRQLVEFALTSGGGRFEVVPNLERRFVVTAGAVSVESLGTVFTVHRLEGDRVRVSVVVGRVRVSWKDGSAELAQNETGAFPPTSAGASPSGSATAPMPPTWLELAKQGDMQSANAALQRAPGQVRDVPNELLLAADVARQNGNLAQATTYLQRVVRNHPSDPRAPVAAFTLGRVYLRSGSPAAAAQAFARSHQLAPGGPLAADAIAREADAWSRARTTGPAKAAARRYLARFPTGAQASRMKQLAGRQSDDAPAPSASAASSR